MQAWRTIHLTRARQVGELMELRQADLPAPELTVRAHYEALRAASPADAVTFIGHALPRHEAIHWAAGLLEAHGAPQAPANDRPERTALDRVRHWLEQPDDARRRDAYAAAQQVDRDAPERMLATALFYSGGSIAPADNAPVQPPPGLSNRLAVAAVVQAGHRVADRPAFLADALHRAEAIAEHGVVSAQ